MLRLPNTLATSKKIKRENQLIYELALDPEADQKIGIKESVSFIESFLYSRGISGGQRKRVSIAESLINDPSVLFLDEPTSGLDSANALSVMQLLKALSAQGRTIIFTIHQPRSNIFKLFDKVLLLHKGHTVYLGSAVNALPYFQKFGFQCEQYTNPADYLIDILLECDGTNREQELIEAFKQDQHQQQYQQPQQGVPSQNQDKNVQSLNQPSQYQQNPHNPNPPHQCHHYLLLPRYPTS